MAPITKLPVEILVRIFRELRDIHVPSCSRGWLSVTHICRKWRLAALDAAELWTQIYSEDPDCVETFLTRSKSAPLDICYSQGGLSHSRLDTVVATVLSKSSRFRHVQMTRCGTAYTFLEHHFPGGAPLLSHLTLMFMPKCTHLAAPTPTPPPIDVMPKICDQGLPALRQLCLRSWPVVPLAPLRRLLNPFIRSLTIIDPCTRCSAQTWADILMGLPRLEELVLASVFPHTGLARQEDIPLIRLPHLSSLGLYWDNSIDQLALLQHIAASGDVHITLDVAPRGATRSLSFAYEQYTDILRALSQMFKQGQRKTLVYPTSLDLQLTHRYLETMLSLPEDTSDSHCSPPLNFGATSPILMLTINGYGAADHSLSAPLSDMLYTTFAWSKLNKLSLGPQDIPCPSYDALELDALKRLFLQMTALRVLSIHEICPSDLLSLLLEPFDRPAGPRATVGTSATALEVLFPALEFLTIARWPRPEEAEFAFLRRALMSRKEAGYPLPRVHICLSLPRGVNPDDFRPQLSRLLAELPKAVGSLRSIGCSVTACGEGGSRCIKELVFTE